ncbi:DNA-binding protein [Halobaculum rubrum]|nr:DNA-binding protein [Halobaculum rubrum]
MTDPYEVPADATAFACPRCGRPFARERHRDLHLGQDHRDLDDDERAAYEHAREAESDALRRFRIVSLGTLVLLYFGFLFLYAIAG